MLERAAALHSTILNWYIISVFEIQPFEFTKTQHPTSSACLTTYALHSDRAVFKHTLALAFCAYSASRWFGRDSLLVWLHHLHTAQLTGWICQSVWSGLATVVASRLHITQLFKEGWSCFKCVMSARRENDSTALIPTYRLLMTEPEWISWIFHWARLSSHVRP